MADLYGRKWSRGELLNYAGDMAQVGGIRMVEWSEGVSRGLRVAEVTSGSGLAFSVLLDRGMDIGPANYKGMPLAWISPAGFAHPAYYEPEGANWLRTFGGGLLTGCGLTSVGSPGEDEGESFGLHGRLSHLPVRQVCVDERWEGDECFFVVAGEVRQARVFGENLRLKRKIEVGLGGNTISIEDMVENLGKSASPLMLLYHINLGFPLLDESTELKATPHPVEPRDAVACTGLDDWMHFQAPTADYQEQVFYHDLPADQEGWIRMQVVNRKLHLKLEVRQQKSTLLNLVEWKMMGQGTYVLGLEPANCHVLGRKAEREGGTLQFLEAGEQRRFRVQIEVSEI